MSELHVLRDYREEDDKIPRTPETTLREALTDLQNRKDVKSAIVILRDPVDQMTYVYSTDMDLVTKVGLLHMASNVLLDP